MPVAIATCKVKPEEDPDEEPLLAALAERGVPAEAAAWDDDTVDWAAFDLCVLRSTWNYVHHHAAFLEWLDRTADCCDVVNPPRVARWNLHKTYLRELADRGIPVVPTLWVGRGQGIDLRAGAAARGWDDVVVKPVVGCASFATRRFAAGRLADAAAFLAEQTEAREMMVQPYLRSVEGHGERSVVWLGGAFTHAVRKSSRLVGAHEHASAAIEIATDERELAEAVLAPFVDELLYARIDLVRSDAGTPTLMELELVEPSLFLVQCPAALAHFADAIARRARSAR